MKHKLLHFVIGISLLFLNCEEPNSKPTNPLKVSGQVRTPFSARAGYVRGFFVSLPEYYSDSKKSKLVLVFPGTDTDGKTMKAFVGDGWNGIKGLEANMENTIFVYPDPERRDFPAWNKSYWGWLLGPYGGAAAGMEDIYFVEELLDWLLKNYAIDKDRIFATGHSWGGDMTAVVGCFLGNRFKAIAPVAANRPYWFESGTQPLGCKGTPFVWTFFGKNDEHFAGQEPTNGDFGRAQNDFWLNKNGCSRDSVILNIGVLGESVEYGNCANKVRFTLYSPAFSGVSDQPGHQPPDIYLEAVGKWFNSF